MPLARGEGDQRVGILHGHIALFFPSPAAACLRLSSIRQGQRYLHRCGAAREKKRGWMCDRRMAVTGWGLVRFQGPGGGLQTEPAERRWPLRCRLCVPIVVSRWQPNPAVVEAWDLHRALLEQLVPGPNWRFHWQCNACTSASCVLFLFSPDYGCPRTAGLDSLRREMQCFAD